MVASTRVCPLCGEAPTPAGSRHSDFAAREFHYGVCSHCNLGLVTDPRQDYAALYGESYYAGRGADPTVSYLAEMNSSHTIRELEWSGLAESLRDVDRRSRILDFGCGLGGFVRHLNQQGWHAEGFEDEGFARDWMGDHEIPHIESPQDATYDVIFAVEVVEHLIEPLPVLEMIRRALKPGGRLIITTGNFARASQPLHKWTYASVPDVHVTFWTPTAWSLALTKSGFESELSSLSPAITQYKILKSLPNPAHQLRWVAPAWRPLAKLVDSRFGVSEFANGVAA